MSKLKNWWNWYVLGKYHCDVCNYGWDECGYYAEDYDCGCWLRKDGQIVDETCRRSCPLISWIFLPRIRKRQYQSCHNWDGLCEWYDQKEHQEAVMYDILNKKLSAFVIYYLGTDEEITLKSYYELTHDIVSEYETQVHPAIPYHKQLLDLLHKMWKSFLEEHVKPYFCK